MKRRSKRNFQIEKNRKNDHERHFEPVESKHLPEYQFESPKINITMMHSALHEKYQKEKNCRLKY